MELGQLAAALRASWWLPLIGLIVGGGAALGASYLQTPLYTSSTELFISTTESTSTVQTNQLSQQRAASYARLLTGQDLAERVIERLGLDMSPGELQGEITATAVEGTVMIHATVTDPSAERAQRIADTLGTELNALVGELETPAAGGASPVKVTVIDRPEVAGAPGYPDTKRNVAAGLALGLLAGGGIAAVRASRDRTVKHDGQAAALVGAPVIGHVVRDKRLLKRHVVDGRSASRTVECYRQLRNSLQRLSTDEPPTVIMVTSAVPSEGKTTAVLNLASALADADRKVAILDADLRKPMVAEYLGMDADTGLSDILAGTADIGEVIQGYGGRDIWVVPAGPTPRDPGALLISDQMQPLIDKLRGDNDYVLVDTPALLSVADASGLVGYVDGVLLTVRWGSTQTDELQQAGELLSRVKGKTLGVLLNMVPPKG